MAETRKSRLTAGVFSSTTDLWATPQAFFDELNAEFHFDLDPCALPENAKCKRFFTPEMDGLKQSWGGTESFAIRPTAGPSAHGSRNATRKAASPTRWWLCSFLLAQIRRTSTTTSTTKRSCDLSEADCTSTRHRRVPRSPQWS